jgi:hypothetical protein
LKEENGSCIVDDVSNGHLEYIELDNLVPYVYIIW